MRAPTVLVVSELHERSTDLVCRHLEEMGVEPLRLNSETFPFGSGCSVRVDADEAAFSVSCGQTVLRSEDIRSVWHRRWTYPVYPATFDEATISFCFSEITGLIGGLPHIAELRWVNHIHAERRASNKIFQLSVARALGFRIPETLVSNRKDDVLDFNAGHSNGVIFKPVSGSSILYRTYSVEVIKYLEATYPDMAFDHGQPSVNLVLYTQLLTPEKLEKLGQLKWSPAIFQEHIHKAADVRVTVVGQQLFACLIRSQDRPETSIDFRQMNKGYDLPHEAIELPGDVAAFVGRLMSRLGLVFACIDFVIDAATGEYVFLEANPAGQWLWVEAKTGMPISRALARYLAAPDEDAAHVKSSI